MTEPTLVLASASARRKALLESCGIPFRTLVPEVPETVDRGLAALGRVGIVKALAERKALGARGLLMSSGLPYDAWIVGADTLVESDGEILAKPATAEEARAMIRRLAGRVHCVSTGLALLPGLGVPAVVEAATTEVEFCPLSDTQIDWYVDTGEWVGVAGAYRIQERAAMLVARISGSYSNVVGLPLELFYGMLLRHRFWSR